MRLLVMLITLCLTLSASAQDDCPCCTPGFRQFDFWVGTWTAYTPNGTIAGTNTIDIIQDSCVVRENWISATPGYTGTSYNHFNPQDSTWTQLWVDNQGGSLHLTGTLINGTMVLSSKPVPDGNGNTVTNRITWTPNNDGTVRQHWETHNGDEQWTTAFDGLYKRN